MNEWTNEFSQFVYLVVLLGVSSMEVKTEADSNDINECSNDDKPTIGMYLFIIYDKV